MKRILLPFLLSAALAALPFSGAYAQGVTQATVVGACGTPPNTYVAGTSRNITQDTTGTVCTVSSGGGGGGNVNLTGINGVTPLAGAGATGTGSLRTTQAQDTSTIAGSAPGTAGTPSANVVTVQGITSGTPQTVNLTQVGGTSVSTGAGAVGTGTARVAVGQDTTTIAGAAPLTTGVFVTGPAAAALATAALQPTNAAQGSTTSGQTGPLVQCSVTTAAPTYTTAQTSPLNCTTGGSARVLENNSASILSAVTGAIPAGANLIGKVGFDQTTPGTTNGVQVNAALPAGTNTIGGAIPKGDTSSGATPYGLQTAASTNSTLVSTGAHTLVGVNLESTSTTAMFLRMYDSAGAPTCSSATGFVRSWAIPPAASAGLVGGIAVHVPVQGIKVTTGLSFCITGGVASTDNTNATTGGIVNLDYF